MEVLWLAKMRNKHFFQTVKIIQIYSESKMKILKTILKFLIRFYFKYLKYTIFQDGKLAE